MTSAMMIFSEVIAISSLHKHCRYKGGKSSGDDSCEGTELRLCSRHMLSCLMTGKAEHCTIAGQ
jgi:hypothetical protein